MSTKEQEDLARARRYIQQHDYAAAKSVLKKIRKNPTAQQWLAQIDQIEKRTVSHNKAAIGAIVLCVGLLILAVLGRAVGILPDTTSTKTADGVENEAAQPTSKVIEGVTVLPPTNTFTPNAIFHNTLPPTWTPAPTHTPYPTLTPRPNVSGSDATPSTRYTTENVNVRSGPGTDYDRIGSLPAGSRITVVGEQNGWYEFNFTFGTGWVVGQYTSLNKPQNVDNSGNGSSTTVPACNCNGPDLDCSDFATHSQAQACYSTCMIQRGSDVYSLDGEDNDGRACEALP